MPRNHTPFDFETNKRDPKTGQTISFNPYRLHIQDGMKFYERPVNSGNLWYANGEPAGRVKYVAGDATEEQRSKPGNIKYIDMKAEHIEYKPEPSAQEKINQEMQRLKSERDALRRELQQIEEEKELKKHDSGSSSMEEPLVDGGSGMTQQLASHQSKKATGSAKKATSQGAKS